MQRISIFLFASILLILPDSVLWAADNQVEASPFSESSLPAEYRDDEVLSGSLSPDGHYGLIYPKAEFSAAVEHTRLLLAELKPFRVVIEISPQIFLEHGHNGYEIHWAKGSSAVLVRAEIKWGPDKVLLVPIQNGQAGKIVDLVPKIRKLVRPSYRKSKAASFNYLTDFILEGDYILPAKGKGQVIKEKWSFDEPGRVSILCFCTTDPKDDEPSSWTVRFEGTWDIAKGRFSGQKITRLPSGPRKDQANGSPTN